MIYDGTKTVTAVGFAERLTDHRDYPPGTLYIQALNDNTGAVYVGSENVSSTRGYELRVTSERGDSMTFQFENPYDIWLDVSVASDGVKWALHDTSGQEL